MLASHLVINVGDVHDEVNIVIEVLDKDSSQDILRDVVSVQLFNHVAHR